MHVQRVVGSGVIIIKPHKLKQLSCCYYQYRKFKNYEFATVTYGPTSSPNFTSFCVAIFLNAYNWTFCVKKLGGVRFGQ